MRTAALVMLVTLVAAGCVQAPETSVANGEWTIALITQPQQPTALRPATLQLTIRDGANALMAVDELTAEAWMREMAHEGTRVAFRPVSPGRYQATTTFSMDGSWEIALEGRRSGRTYAARLVLRVGK